MAERIKLSENPTYLQIKKGLRDVIKGHNALRFLKVVTGDNPGVQISGKNAVLTVPDVQAAVDGVTGGSTPRVLSDAEKTYLISEASNDPDTPDDYVDGAGDSFPYIPIGYNWHEISAASPTQWVEAKVYWAVGTNFYTFWMRSYNSGGPTLFHRTYNRNLDNGVDGFRQDGSQAKTYYNLDLGLGGAVGNNGDRVAFTHWVPSTDVATLATVTIDTETNNPKILTGLTTNGLQSDAGTDELNSGTAEIVQ